MLARHVTIVYFLACLALAGLSLALALLVGDIFLLLVAASFGFTIYSIRKSEKRGFVRSSQIRRAFEPARHFNGAQTFVLFGTLVVQAIVAAYLLLTP